MHALLAISILGLTITLALRQPLIAGYRIRPESAALAGGMMAILLGLAPLEMVAQMLKNLAPGLITIISLMTITLITEKSGLLAILANQLALRAGGNSQTLITYLFVLGALTGTLFTNDAAILILTPLVYALVEQIQLPDWTAREKLPFYFVVLYIGNLVGPLVISNPINIIVSGFFDIGFSEYFVWMLIPALISMVVSLYGLRWYFRRSIPPTFCPPVQASLAGQAGLQRLSLWVLGFVLAGFFSSTLTGIPVWMIALGGALILTLIAGRYEVTSREIIRGIGWDVLLFVIGIFVVVLALRHAGLTAALSLVITEFAELGNGFMLFATGLLTGICSAIFNNHPTSGMMIWVIQDLNFDAQASKLLVYAALIGGDLGPKMLPIGSLAALLWFRMLRDRGVEVSYWTYVKVGVPVTLAAIVLALLALILQATIFNLL